MKKLIIKISIISFCTIFIILALNYFYINTNYYISKVSLQKTKERYETITNEPEILNLGSSHGQNSFDYSKFDIRGVNAGLGSQPLFMDYQVLLKYEEYLNVGTIIVLPISYFSFTQDINSSEYESSLRRYEKIIDYYYFGETLSAKLYNELPVISSKDKIRHIIKDIKLESNESKGLFNGTFAEDELIDIGQKRYNYHTESDCGVILDENIEMMNKIVDFCEAKRLKLVLVTTPFTYYYTDNVDAEYIKEVMYDVIYKYRDEYNIPYYDYSCDTSIVRNIQYFRDTDHLNNAGRQVFTEKFLMDLDLIE